MAKTDKEKVSAVPTSVRLSATGEQLWQTLANRMGLSKAKALEVIIRDRARAEGLEVPTTNA